jgi:hypothetical protein
MNFVAIIEYNSMSFFFSKKVTNLDALDVGDMARAPYVIQKIRL